MEKRQLKKKEAFRFKHFARKAYSAFNSLGKLVSIGVIAGCTLTFMSASAVAQDGQVPAKIIEKELNEILITASLAEVPLEEATKSVIVITKQEVQQAPIKSINDLLAHIASIDLVQRGGHGVQADLSIRGGTLDQTAVLINGINLSNAQTGHYSLDIPINLSDIQYIEILHGPAALIYGSSAFSGGINIITKKEASEKLIAKVEAGTHKLLSAEVRGSLNFKNTTHSLSASAKSTDGYAANTDYDLYNILWQSRLHLKKKNKIDFQFGFNDKQYGANTFYSAKFPNQYEKTRNYMATLKGSFGDKIKFIPAIYWNRHYDRFDLVRNTTLGQNYHRGDTYGANFTLTSQWKLGATSIVSEIRKDEMMSTKLGFALVEKHGKYSKYDARTNTSAGLEHAAKIDKLILSAGVLMSHNSIENSKYHLLPSIGANYSLTSKLKLHTSWSKSTRVPTFTDLHYTTETHTANESLKSEQSQSWELGTKYSTDFISAYATGYLSWGRNMIDWVKETAETETWSSWNHSKIDTKGLEVGIQFSLYKLYNKLGKQASLKLDYSRIFQNVDTEEMISLYSLNYMKRKFTARLNHTLYKNLNISYFFRFQNRAGEYIKYENLKPAHKEKYPSFTTLDIRLDYQIQKININLDINNLYSTKYFDLGNIPQSGFWLTGGISYTI